MLKSKIIFLTLSLDLIRGTSLSQNLPQSRPGQLSPPSVAITVPIVLVDVIVTDGKDKHVDDLRPDEFVLFEDGVKQILDSVEFRHADGARVMNARDTQAPNLREGKAEPPAARSATHFNIITFLLDYSTTEFVNQKYVREAAIKYIKERVGSNDRVAIFSTGGSGLRVLQSFTNDKNLLVACLAKSDLSGSSNQGERALLNSEITRQRQTASAGSGSSGSLGAGADYVPGAPLFVGDPYSGPFRVMLARRIENSFLAMRSFLDSQTARPVLTAIKSIALALQEIPGRKTLVLFSEGFAVPPNVEGLLRDAVDCANKSNLAIYSIDSRGLKNKEGSARGELDSINAAASSDIRGTGRVSEKPLNVGVGGTRTAVSSGESQFDRAHQVGSDQDESTLRFVANSTGGFIIRNTNDFEKGLQRIDDDLRTYYLLSYRPTNLEFDGKFRELRVEVTRPGLKVRARGGYFATSPTDSLLDPDQRVLFAAARQHKSVAALPLFVSAEEFFPEAGASVAVFTVEVSAEALKFRENGANFDDSMQMIGLITQRTGQSITTFGRSVPLLLNKT